jgi:hypothetical protein
MAIINDGNDLQEMIKKYQVGKVTTDRSQENIRALASSLIEEISSKNSDMSSRCQNLAAQLFSSKTAVEQITYSLNSVK